MTPLLIDGFQPYTELNIDNPKWTIVKCQNISKLNRINEETLLHSSGQQADLQYLNPHHQTKAILLWQPAKSQNYIKLINSYMW